MMLFGAKLEPDAHNSRPHYQCWVGWTDGGARVSVANLVAIETFSVRVTWPDTTMVVGYGPTFDDAKRDCVRMLSQRSRECGRV